MFRLKKDNVEKVVATEDIRDVLIGQGFEVVELQAKPLEEMSIDELKHYAEEKGIDIGKASSINGILDKIKEHEEE